jgi:glutamate decarboxylase
MDDDIVHAMTKYMPYNKINRNEYEFISEMEGDCIKFLAALLHAPAGQGAFGLATTGSSEAIMLACHAWRHVLPRDVRPNMIVSPASHSAWLNAANLLGIEVREVDFLSRDLEQELLWAIDPETIGVAVTLGTTATGLFEPAYEVNEILVDYRSRSGRRIPLHIDAASGGFIAPFYHESLQWDFVLSHVDSINVSGHKYGMVYASVGWALWRNAGCRNNLGGYEVEYLKGEFDHCGISFSSPSMYVVGQYLCIKKYGVDGFRNKVSRLYRLKEVIEERLKRIPGVVVLSATREPRLPVVCWTAGCSNTMECIANALDSEGWVAPHSRESRASKRSCIRFVIRHHLTDSDVQDLISATVRAVGSVVTRERNEAGE